MEPFTARAQGKPADQLKNKYSQIEVTRFETKNGVDVPVEYLDALTKDLVNELRAIKKFEQVYSPSDNSQRASATTLKLIGQVTMFQPGSRLKRYFIGWGAGKTKIVAQVKIEDGATKETLFEKTVDGKVLLGGEDSRELLSVLHMGWLKK